MIRADVKPALMTTVEAEFDKNPKQPAFEPARTSRAAKAGGGGGAAPKAAGGAAKGGRGGGGGGAATSTGAFDSDDLLPREDISGAITSKLVAELGSANWKERKAAMDEVEGLLAAAGGRIQPNVGARRWGAGGAGRCAGGWCAGASGLGRWRTCRWLGVAPACVASCAAADGALARLSAGCCRLAT